MVLEDPSHSSGENPWVGMYMTLGTGNTPDLNSPVDLNLFINTHREFIADVNNPYFKQSAVASNVVYKDWQCMEYDLTAYMGSVVSFNFIARDCSQGAHFGYAYLDGLCTSWPAIAAMTINKTEFCDNEQPIIVDASASTGEDRWFLEVAEVDASGNTVAGGDKVGEWYLGQQASAYINVNQFFASKNKAFKCGSYYRVNVAVMNECAQWNVQSRFIHFTCPPIDAGPDRDFCCGTTNPDTLSLGQLPVQMGLSYGWQSFPTGFTSSLAQPSVPTPSLSTAYILTVTDGWGCKAKDSVIVRYQNPDMILDAQKSYYDGYKVCDLTKYYNATVINADCPGEDPYFIKNYPSQAQNHTVQWQFVNTASSSVTSTGTGQFFNAPNADGVTQAIVSNGCVTRTYSDNVEFKQNNTSSLIGSNSLTPNGGNPLF